MAPPPSRDDLARVRKLARLPAEARACSVAVSITRLTVLKALCRSPDVAARFVTDLAVRTRVRVEAKAEKPGSQTAEAWARYREVIGRGVAAMEAFVAQPSEAGRSGLRTLYHEAAREQDEHRRVHGTSVRVIQSTDLLLVEYALRTVAAGEREAPVWAYQTARCYAERYDSSHGTGLTPESAPLVQDIADFWVREFGLDADSLTDPPAKRMAATPATTRSDQNPKGRETPATFTPRQGQFLAFIRLYRLLHRRGPAEAEMVRYFGTTPPAVHGMVVKLEELGLVTREPGVPRSVRVAATDVDVPALEPVAGPPW